MLGKKFLILLFVLVSGIFVFAADYVTPVSSVTDPVRSLGDFVGQFDYITRFIVLALTVFLLYVSYTAYNKSKSERLFFVFLAFGLFFVKWLLKVFDIFFSPGEFFASTYQNVSEFLILGALFLALFKK
ncbi:MAG: hypothetical protein Q7K42_04515 [Candidatus Diapherotrites archaeon]|nr:hypothetical protein [Candidatus Diapherotrites archaeon]